VDGMRLSALRLPLFVAHDLVRKPDTTFRDHAHLSWRRCCGQTSDAVASRERIFIFVIAGLDPAIHAEDRLDRISRWAFQNRDSSWTTGSQASEATPFFERLCPVVTKKENVRAALCSRDACRCLTF
jgi:hypothetical protein